MIKMRVCDQHVIDRREVFDADARHTQTLQEEQPLRKVRVHEDVLPADL